MIKGDVALTDISAFQAIWNEQKSILTLQPAWQDENYANAYVPI